MKIDPHSPLGPSSSVKKKKKSGDSDSGFASLLDETDEIAGKDQVYKTSPVSAMNSVLALQEVSDDEVNRKKAVRQGNLTLDAIEELRVSVLMGEIPPERLDKIQTRLKEQKLSLNDPVLLQVMQEIEIRVAVELAKYGR